VTKPHQLGLSVSKLRPLSFACRFSFESLVYDTQHYSKDFDEAERGQGEQVCGDQGRTG
jgi:hypothetical protein